MIKLLYGDLYSQERVRFIGLNIQNIFNVAYQNGIILKNAVRVDYAVMEADVYRVHIKKLKKLLKKYGYKTETVKRRGVTYQITSNKHRIFLFLFLLSAVIGLILIFSRTYSIKVMGYEDAEKIKSIVVENGMLDWRKNAFKRIEETKKAISQSDKNILWNSITINGTVIEVYIREDSSIKIPADEEGKIVAKKDCVIRNLIVTSGTKAVENGTLVSKGQVLIENTQKFGEEVFDVHAEGKAIASVWYYGSEEILEETTVYNETGRTANAYEINFFGINIFSEKEKFLNYITEYYRVNTFFLPIKINKLTYKETKEEIKKTDKDRAIKEAETAIINKLKLQIPDDAKLVETKTSVYEEDGFIKVSVYIETAENVAIRG